MMLDLGVVCLQNFHGNFEAWRWLLMIGVLVPINHVGNLLVKMLVWLVEYVFWFQKKALYYLVGTKVCIPEFVSISTSDSLLLCTHILLVDTWCSAPGKRLLLLVVLLCHACQLLKLCLALLCHLC